MSRPSALAVSLAAALSLAVCVAGAQAGPTAIDQPPTSDVCVEDEACWDCNVHGNGLCFKGDPTPFQP